MRKQALIVSFIVVLLLAPTLMVSGAPFQALVTEDVARGDPGITVSLETGDGNSSLRDYEGIANQMMEQARRSWALLNGSLEDLDDADVPPPVREQMTEAIRLLGEAKTLKEDGDFKLAAEVMLDALHNFGNALRSLEKSKPELPVRPEDDVLGEDEKAERARGLAVAAERALDYMMKVNMSAVRLAEDGMDATPVMERIHEAVELLNRTRKYIDDQDVDRAANELGGAREVLAEANVALNRVINAHKEQVRVESYVDQLKTRIKSLNGTIDSLLPTLNATNVKNVKAKLTIAVANAERIKNLIKVGNATDLLNALEVTARNIGRDLVSLNGNNTGVKLTVLNQIEAKVQVMQKSAEKLAERGMEYVDIHVEASNAEAVMEQLKERLTEGKMGEFDEIAENIRARLSNLTVKLTSSTVNRIKSEIVSNVMDAIKTNRERVKEVVTETVKGLDFFRRNSTVTDSLTNSTSGWLFPYNRTRSTKNVTEGEGEDSFNPFSKVNVTKILPNGSTIVVKPTKP